MHRVSAGVLAVCLAMSACGTPRPVQQRVVEAEVPPDAPLDAEVIDADLTDADLGFLTAPAVDARDYEAEAAAEVLAKQAALVADDLAEFYDNGIRIIPTRMRPYCGKSRIPVCGLDAGHCRVIARGCAPVVNIACFTGTSRTDGRVTPFCTPTYGTCMKLRYAAEAGEEFDVPDECAIMRYTPRAKK